MRENIASMIERAARVKREKRKIARTGAHLDIATMGTNRGSVKPQRAPSSSKRCERSCSVSQGCRCGSPSRGPAAVMPFISLVQCPGNPLSWVMSLLAEKSGIVFGVANKRSIAWAIAQAWHKAGAKLAFTYQVERLKENVEELAGTFGADTLILPCDVTKHEQLPSVFTSVGEKFGKLHLLL